MPLNALFKSEADPLNTVVAPLEDNVIVPLVASGVSDNGISFGASLDIDGDTTRATSGNTFGENAGDTEVYISGDFGTITIGDVGHATDLDITEAGFDGIGAEDLAHSDTTTGLTSDIKYSYSMNGVT